MSVSGSATVHSATLVGADPVPVEVQVDVSPGLPGFRIVGLADAAVLEARERVRSAIRSAGHRFPNAHVLVNLAPATLRKHGTGFDLPIAAGVLVATGQIPASTVAQALLVGELSLEGDVRPVPGLLAHAVAARQRGLRLVGPSEIGGYPRNLPGLSVHPATHVTGIAGESCDGATPSAETLSRPAGPALDMSDVAGHRYVKRALEIAAAGGHNLLMIGPPGCGKSMLASRLPGILPPLTAEERISTALLHSVGGLDVRPALEGVRPFRAPHHSSSVAGLIGGGSPPRPGEISLAHNGVLFLDELPEFGPASLQALRQPLEDGRVTLVRAEGRIGFPCDFALVAAANPCPCGYYGDQHKECRCTPRDISRYANRVGGPLFDRIDMTVEVSRVDPGAVLAGGDGDTSGDVRGRVVEAREIAQARDGVPAAGLSGTALLGSCRLDAGAVACLEDLARARMLSGRGITRVLRVARTVADLDRCDRVNARHLNEVLGYRMRDRGTP